MADSSQSGGGLSGFLWNGAPQTQFQGSASFGPAWLQSAIYSTLGAAGNLAQQPYQPFPGPQIADPSAQTKQAWQMAGSNVGNYQPFLDQAQSLTQRAAAPITGQDIQGFLNPYQSYITKQMDQNLNQNVLPGISDRFVRSGQSRSPQEALLTGYAVNQNQQDIGQSLAGAYQGAVNSLLQERGQLGSLGAQSGQLGALTQQLGAGDISQVAGAGQAQDSLSQANINAAMQNFQNQQQWPYQQLGFLSNIEHGIPLGAVGSFSNSSGQYYPQTTSGFGALGSAASQLASLPWKKGGHVQAHHLRGALSEYARAA